MSETAPPLVLQALTYLRPFLTCALCPPGGRHGNGNAWVPSRIQCCPTELLRDLVASLFQKQSQAIYEEPAYVRSQGYGCEHAMRSSQSNRREMFGGKNNSMLMVPRNGAADWKSFSAHWQAPASFIMFLLSDP